MCGYSLFYYLRGHPVSCQRFNKMPEAKRKSKKKKKNFFSSLHSLDLSCRLSFTAMPSCQKLCLSFYPRLCWAHRSARDASLGFSQGISDHAASPGHDIALCFPHYMEYPSEPLSHKKLPSQTPFSWAFGSDCCLPHLLPPSSGKNEQHMSLNISTDHH